MNVKKGDIVFNKFGEWFEVKDVRPNGFITIRRPGGAWKYVDPKEFTKEFTIGKPF